MLGSKNFTIYEGQDYKVRLEYSREYVIVHLPQVSKFNKTVLVSMLIKISEIADFAFGLGYPALHCAAPMHDKKINKLAKRVGFVLLDYHGDLAVYKFNGGQYATATPSN